MIDGLFQPIHLVLILAIIMIVFGAGKLPEMGGAIGRGIKEFRNEVRDGAEGDSEPVTAASQPTVSVSAPAAHFCTSCGERMPAGAKFCPNCGASNAPATTETIEAIPVEPEAELKRAEHPIA